MRQGGKGYNVGSTQTSLHRQLRKNLPSSHTTTLKSRPEREALERKHPREDGEILKVQSPGRKRYRRNRKGTGPERLTGPGQIMGVPATLLPEVPSPPGMWPLWAMYMKPINKPEETVIKKNGKGSPEISRSTVYT